LVAKKIYFISTISGAIRPKNWQMDSNYRTLKILTYRQSFFRIILDS